jgi:hypothetical protein
MGIVHPHIPFILAWRLKKAFGLRTFVETGTHVGETSAWAAEQFDQVETVEAYEPLFEHLRTRFKDKPNVALHFGTSAEMLRRIVPGLDGPALFWLDAHYSGQGTAGEARECPILDEIAALDLSPHDNVVLIDDARLFLVPPPAPFKADHWPDLRTIIETLSRKAPDSYITIFEDVIIRVPGHAKATLVHLLQTQEPQLKPGAEPSREALERIEGRLQRIEEAVTAARQADPAAELAQIKASLPWRLTAPLRALRRRLG